MTEENLNKLTDTPGQTESALQQKIVIWFHNRYSTLRGCLCYNNNNSDGSYRGKQSKSLGVIPGRSDLVLYFNGKAYMIELKTEKGSQSKTQKGWEELIVSHGFNYFIVRSLEEFKKLINTIIH